jgi:K+/H+ antiporter YhaU regulatory subunit KhtT
LDLKELDLKCKKDEIISKETQALSLKTTEKQV